MKIRSHRISNSRYIDTLNVIDHFVNVTFKKEPFIQSQNYVSTVSLFK